MSPEIAEVYGNKVRIRVSGLCWKEDSLLMVRHRMGPQGFWSPPGGGVEFGESLEEALKREFLEETGLQVISEKFLFGCELIKTPLHAIELFFEVKVISGVLTTGYDPEIQLIDNTRFLSADAIEKMPEDSVHRIVKKYKHAKILRQLVGFHRI